MKTKIKLNVVKVLIALMICFVFIGAFEANVDDGPMLMHDSERSFETSDDSAVSSLAVPGNYVHAFTAFQPINSSCSKELECKTKNCFKGICRDEVYCDANSDCSSDQCCYNNKCEVKIKLWGAFILCITIFFISLSLVYFVIIKKGNRME